MDAQVATILEVINIYRSNNQANLSTEAKQTQLPYYTSTIQAKIHEDTAYVVDKTKKWDKTNPECCRVINIYDFVIHAATTVVTIVDKQSKLYREGNQIKGGRNFYIRSINRYMGNPHGLFHVTDCDEDLLLEIKNKNRDQYIESAKQLREWYNNQNKDSNIYVHYGGFDLAQRDIDLFIVYVNSLVN